MPLYEYQCDACSKRFERIQKFSDPHVEICPSCGGHVTKLLSSPAIQFKGSGFYITDYAKPGSRTDSDSTGKTESAAAEKAEAKSEVKPDSKSETKSEGKPETKSETKPDTKSESKPAKAPSPKE